MGGVADFVSDVVGGVVDAVGDVASAVVDTASSVVEAAGNVVNTVVEAAVNDPIGTAAKVAAVATGNAWALPAISAGDVILHGGNLEQAALAAGTTYVAQGVADYVGEQLSTPTDYTGPGIGEGAYTPDAVPPPVPDIPVEVGAAIPDSSIESNPLPALPPEAPVAPPADVPVQDMGEITVTAPRPDVPVSAVIPGPDITPDNIDAGGGQNFADVPVSDAVPSIVNPDTDFVPKEPLVSDYVPIILTPGAVMPTAPTRRPLTPLDPTVFGQTASLVDPGLNPGMITDVPEQYNTTSPVQSKFYWGGHPYQTGETFDRDLYKQSPGVPAQPYGLQQMYTPTDINAYLQSLGIGPIAPKTGA